MLLDKSNSEIVQPIFSAVKNNLPVEKIIELSQALKIETVNREFPLIYASILLATSQRISDSIRILSLCSHPFGVALRKYLEETEAFIPATNAFQETKPYDVWIKTNFYQTYMTTTIDTIKEFATLNPPPNNSPTIIDIGTGNGVLISEIIKQLILDFSLKEINLILLDQSPEMLNAAIKYCQESLAIPLKITPICSTVENMIKNPEILSHITETFWFINAAASLHHLPKETKLPTLKFIRNLSVPCLITECQGNHDQPEKNSPELVYSVAEFYGFFIEDLNHCNVSEKDKEICLHNLVLTEAITILSNTRNSRKDYHALISEWEDLGEKAGFNIAKITPNLSFENNFSLFTMELQPN